MTNQQNHDIQPGELHQFIDHYEQLELQKETQREALVAQQHALMKDAEERGYDTKVLRQIIDVRRPDNSMVLEAQSIFALYKAAAGLT